MVVAVGAALAVGVSVSTPGELRWSHHEALGPTQAFCSPALLLMPDHTIIWQPGTGDTPLVAQSRVTGHVTGILPYPDVKPERWQAAPASPDTYHIVWLERDGRLRSALIGVGGDTLRGPITLAFRAGRDFTTTALPDQRMLVVWRSPASLTVTAQIIDPAGRPDVASLVTLGRAERIAVAADQTGNLHVAWLEAGPAGQYTIAYQTTTPDRLGMEAPAPIHTVNLTPTQSIAALMLGLDQTHVYVIWSRVDAVQPDHEQVYVLAFPFGQPDRMQIIDLRLPQQPEPYRAAPASLDRVRPLAGGAKPVMALRWPAIAPGQHAILPLAITYRAVGGWFPGVIYFQHGAPLGYQTLADYPANAGPPTLLVDPVGQVFAAWSGLDGTLPILYTAALTDRGLVASSGNPGWRILVVGVLAWVVVWGGMRWLRPVSSA